jgi:hypothetical protein
MLIIRFLAIFVYIIAALLALKFFSNLASGQARVDESWWSTVLLLIGCVIIAISAWLVDRTYCRNAGNK